MTQKHPAAVFTRAATTAEGEVTIRVDDKSTTFTVRDSQGHISQVTSDALGLSSIVDGAPRMFPEAMEQRLARSVAALGQCLRAKGNLSPDDFTSAALVAFNVESVPQRQACR